MNHGGVVGSEAAENVFDSVRVLLDQSGTASADGDVEEENQKNALQKLSVRHFEASDEVQHVVDEDCADLVGEEEVAAVLLGGDVNVGA